MDIYSPCAPFIKLTENLSSNDKKDISGLYYCNDVYSC